MTIKETLNLISETQSVLVEDYTYIHKKEPTNLDLINHVKTLVKTNNVEEILEDVLIEEDIEDVLDLYKLLLLTAASLSKIASSD